MTKLDLSIIIVSYNTADLLVESIKSIIDTVRNISYEIIVVDNASTDETIEKISNFKSDSIGFKFQISNFKLIKNKENVGFSKANNIGIKHAQGRYVLFLNPDTVIYESTLDGMVKFMDNNKSVGAATCFIQLPNKRLDDSSHRGFPTPWRSFCHFSYLSKLPLKYFRGYNLSYLNMDKAHEIDACNGAFMLVRQTAGEKAGWWDEDYFWYGEDLDFCYRLKEKGWKIYFVPEYKILHYKGVSGGLKKISKNLSKANAQIKQKAIDARFAAMKIFYSKHYKNVYPRLFSSLVVFGINSRWYLSKKINEYSGFYPLKNISIKSFLKNNLILRMKKNNISSSSLQLSEKSIKEVGYENRD